MPIGIIQEAMAARALRYGAIGIGEDHTERDGRDLARLLIQGGSVRCLFVELAENVYQSQIEAAVEVREAAHESVRRHLFFGSIHRCEVMLEDVVADAIVNNIPVYCVDDRIAMNPTRSSRPAGMRKRNTTIVANILNVLGLSSAREGGAAGSLLIFSG